MDARMLKSGIFAFFCIGLAFTSQAQRKPNIIYILGDDLGRGEIGAYGQKKIKTPNIDRLAKEGMLFTRHYSGCAVCAPSRCALLTGTHTGHTFIRGNKEVGTWESFNGQLPLPEATQTIATVLKKAGYTTACIGKWGLGGVGTSGDPKSQGFDYFFGYNCQRHAHNYYPQYLYRNQLKIEIDNPDIKEHTQFPKEKDPMDPENYQQFVGNTYAPALMEEEAIKFIQRSQDQPFFLFFATPLPHLGLQVPASEVEPYKDLFDDKPYLGDKGYVPCRYPRATYAAMVTYLDKSIGQIMEVLRILKLEKDTLICLVGDNGPTFNGGTDSAYFESALNLKGLKASVYEGGLLAPCIMRWPKMIPAGTTSPHLSSMWDMLPTFASIAGASVEGPIDGISMLPTLIGQGEAQKKHEYLYWECAGNLQALRQGDWKLVIRHLKKETSMELYNLKDDPSEAKDLKDTHPDIVARMLKKVEAIRTDSKEFPLKK
jgi:arylsulfatase